MSAMALWHTELLCTVLLFIYTIVSSVGEELVRHFMSTEVSRKFGVYCGQISPSWLGKVAATVLAAH